MTRTSDRVKQEEAGSQAREEQGKDSAALAIIGRGRTIEEVIQQINDERRDLEADFPF